MTPHAAVLEWFERQNARIQSAQSPEELRAWVEHAHLELIALKRWLGVPG